MNQHRIKKLCSLGMIIMLIALLTACSASESDPEPKSYPEGTMAAVLAADGRFTTLLSLTDEISGPHGDTPLLTRTDEQNRTLFAPTDEAFAALSPELMELLQNDPRAAEELLFHHLLDRQLQAKDFELLPQWPTFLTIVKVGITVDGEEILYDGVPVSETDIAATNGLIHVLDSVAGTHLLTD